MAFAIHNMQTKELAESVRKTIKQNLKFLERSTLPRKTTGRAGRYGFSFKIRTAALLNINCNDAEGTADKV